MRNAVASMLLTLWLMPRVAIKIWWLVASILLVGVGIGLYHHALTYALWGMAVAVVATLFISILELQSLNGTGWIPPAWFISLIK